MTILGGAHAVLLGESLSKDRISLGLSAQAARVALRIADLVEAHCTPESAVPAVTFLRSWAEHAWQAGAAPLAEYAAGSWRPAEADALLIRDGRAWHYPLA